MHNDNSAPAPLTYAEAIARVTVQTVALEQEAQAFRDLGREVRAMRERLLDLPAQILRTGAEARR